MTQVAPAPTETHDPEDYIVFELLDMLSPHYTVLVRSFLLGQYRICITDKRKFDEYAPPGHGGICREMCTYSYTTMLATVLELESRIDSLAYCEALERPYNCEYPGGRIRLDNTPRDRT